MYKDFLLRWIQERNRFSNRFKTRNPFQVRMDAQSLTECLFRYKCYLFNPSQSKCLFKFFSLRIAFGSVLILLRILYQNFLCRVLLEFQNLQVWHLTFYRFQNQVFWVIGEDSCLTVLLVSNYLLLDNIALVPGFSVKEIFI